MASLSESGLTGHMVAAVAPETSRVEALAWVVIPSIVLLVRSFFLWLVPDLIPIPIPTGS